MIMAVVGIIGSHTIALQDVHVDVTHVTSTHFVPLSVLVLIGFIGPNKSLSHTQLQGFGNCNPTMCQEESELEIPLNNTNDYQSFIDGPGPWINHEGRTFSLGAFSLHSVTQSPFLPPLELVTM